MTGSLVAFELQDGSTVIFEANDLSPPPAATERIARTSIQSELQKSQEPFEQVAARIRPAAQIVLDALQELNSPKEIGLEFGLAFNAKAGVVIASASSEVNFKVSVKWENPGA